MKYDLGTGDLTNWMVCEDNFDTHYLGKCETIMALGNGYLGVRSATEERYSGEVRNTFIAGTFNRFDALEVTELPNCADVYEINFEIDGQLFHLTQGIVKSYQRFLNLKNGELTRKIIWISQSGKEIEFTFKRFISLDNRHLSGQQISMVCKNGNVNVIVKSGINGQMTNSGVQHFSEGEKRLFESDVLQMVQTTTESKIDIIVTATHTFESQGKYIKPESMILMDRRKIYNEFEFELEESKEIVITKYAYFSTSRDLEFEKKALKEIRKHSVQEIIEARQRGYEALIKDSEKAWHDQIWSECPIQIDSENAFDQLSIRFSQYHMRIMTPYHDNRMNIGAKGLTGEGYKGHTFWDTEIFILPYYIYSHPQIARRLLEYRYLCLSGAREKARANGYLGAMFPWESAWITDGEVTPIWGAADIVSGKSTKIWSGFIEQHITADIAFATWQYFQITNDLDFMEQYGYEIIFETARFWSSRLEYSEEDQLLHINGVIGPDEYKEHIDDNAFTNYMAVFNMRLAIDYYEKLKMDNEHLFQRLNKKIGVDQIYKDLIEDIKRVYLPVPDDFGVIPQDKTYMSKKNIDLSPYKAQKHVGSLFRKYNLKQVNDLQVSKQADVLILMYLLENLFDKTVKLNCWDYYEPRTLHDSSLSLSTHSVLASDLGLYSLAYNLFSQAAEIDLGNNMKTSDHGIHGASLGGVWQCVINGFGGVRMLDGKLRIEPHLPENWQALTFSIYWQGEKLQVAIKKDEFIVTKLFSEKYITIEAFGTHFMFNDRVRVSY